MCYLVTWMEAGTGRSDKHQVIESEEDAKNRAEHLLRNGATDVALWKQHATPSIEQVVKW